MHNKTPVSIKKTRSFKSKLCLQEKKGVGGENALSHKKKKRLSEKFGKKKLSSYLV